MASALFPRKSRTIRLDGCRRSKISEDCRANNRARRSTCRLLFRVFQRPVSTVHPIPAAPVFVLCITSWLVIPAEVGIIFFLPTFRDEYIAPFVSCVSYAIVYLIIQRSARRAASPEASRNSDCTRYGISLVRPAFLATDSSRRNKQNSRDIFGLLDAASAALFPLLGDSVLLGIGLMTLEYRRIS